MIINQSRRERTSKRHRRIRKKLTGTGERPRLSVFRSNKHLYAQIINDEKGHTLTFCSTLSSSVKNKFKVTWSKEAAKKVGELIAQNALEKGIKNVVFDRGGNRYHGKILAFAEGARSGGLKF